MSDDEIANAEARVKETSAKIEAGDKEIAEIKVKLKTLREDPVLLQEAALIKDIESLKASIKQRMDEAIKASKSVSEAVVREKANLVKLKTALMDAGSDIASAKNAELSLYTTISSFDEVLCQKDMRLGEEAKKAKPKREVEKNELLEKKEQCVVAISQFDTSIASAEVRIDKFKKSLIEMGDGQNLTCPECESPVSRDHIDNKIKLTEDEVVALKKARQEASLPLIDLQRAIAEVNKRLTNIEEYSRKGEDASKRLVQHNANKEALKLAKKRTEDSTKRQAEAVQSVSESEKSLEALQASAQKFVDEANADTAIFSTKIQEITETIRVVVKPQADTIKLNIKEQEDRQSDLSANSKTYAATIASDTKAIEVSQKMKVKVAKMVDEVATKTKEQERLAVVEGGFGLDGIRVQIIEKYIPLLNVYIDEFLEVVSGKMTMDVTTNDKEEIKMKIKGAAASDPKQLSKGQFARVKVATDLSLGMMSLARNENAPDFVCLDEVFAPVDTNGKKAMFDVILKLQEYFRMVIVISHDSLVQETIKDTIVVNMVNDVSTIEKQAYGE
jgi:DNA repair exonuclease SbcCD ATPase subunit